MPEPWDMPPAIPPPCYPIEFGTGGIESLEMQERREEIRQHHELWAQARLRQWCRVERVGVLREWMKTLQICQKTPASQRSRDIVGFVYLMWCPSLGVYKIGLTDAIVRRVGELRVEVDPLIECRVAYRTPVLLRLMEGMLHIHYSPFRFSSEISDELFNLPQDEADGFEATAATIEGHLLAIELFRLEARLSQLEAEARLLDAEEGFLET